MPTFQTQVIRIAADTTSKDNVLDLNTSAEPEAWWARNLCVQVGVFAGPALLDVSDLQSVSLYLKDPSNLDGAPLVTKTVTTFDNTTTLTTWQAGTQQHFPVIFSADDLSFSLTNALAATTAQRLVHLSIVAITTGGQTGTICVGTLNVIDDGGNSPSSNPVNAITVTQAQAMMAALSVNNAVIPLSAAGTTAVASAQTWLIGRQPISLAAGSGAYVANLTLSDANPLPGALVRIPIDFPASANPTINIYDNSTAGTLLEGPLANPNPGTPASFLFTAGFDGESWHKESGVWIQ
jgi:hypothetical protein